LADDVPISEKEEISQVFEAVALNRPAPLASGRLALVPDSSTFKLRAIISEALGRQAPKSMSGIKRQLSVAESFGAQGTPGVTPAVSEPPSPSHGVPGLKKKKNKKIEDDDEEDEFLKKPKKKKSRPEDASPPSSAPPTPSVIQTVRT